MNLHVYYICNIYIYMLFTMFHSQCSQSYARSAEKKVAKAMPGRDGPSSSAWPVGKAAASRRSAKREARSARHLRHTA